MGGPSLVSSDLSGTTASIDGGVELTVVASGRPTNRIAPKKTQFFVMTLPPWSTKASPPPVDGAEVQSPTPEYAGANIMYAMRHEFGMEQGQRDFS